MMSQASVDYIQAQNQVRQRDLAKARAAMLAQLAQLSYSLATEVSRKLVEVPK